MNIDESGVTDLLLAASDDPPPSRVDLPAVLKNGHRRRRRRVLLPLAAAFVSVALVAAGAIWVVGRSPAGPPVRSADPSPTLSPTPTLTAPSRFPLDHRLFDLAGLPAGARIATVSLFVGSQLMDIEGLTTKPVVLTVYAAGVDDPWLTRTGFDRHPAPSIFGLPATFRIPAGGASPYRALTFQWAAGAYAELGANGASEELMLAWASGLRLIDPVPVRFAFAVTVPQALHLAVVAIQTSETRPPGLTFAIGGEPPLRMPMVEESDPPLVSIGLRTKPNADPPQQPNIMISGHSAYVEHTESVKGDPTYRVSLLDIADWVVTVQVSGSGATQLFSADQANALALSVQTLGKDSAQWTDNPIR
jgi:hypothetical protein